ncbi:MAG TPA: hypothetical protein VNC50_05845 [Planctomycetia bacterium]|nr:hypothetical protein [Planctomycetia bacterium]
MGLFDWFRGSAECPVSPETREWIDWRWEWLENEFGKERVRSAPLVLPRAQFFPDAFHSTEECAAKMFVRVCGYMDVDPATVQLSFFEDRDPLAGNPSFGAYRHDGAAGLYHADGDAFHIHIEAANLLDPLSMVGTMAHELGHVHLLGHGRVGRDEEDHEPLTDLLTVFLGLGMFTANSVVKEKSWTDGSYSGWSIGRQGYLTMPDYGYAFSRFALSRCEDGSKWAGELRLDVRSAFKQAMRFHAKNGKPAAAPAD